MSVPDLRTTVSNPSPLRGEADYVLYWMTAFRRPHYNFALDRAIEIAREVKKPLLVIEPLRVGYRWASDRLHQFVLQGMADNAAAFARAGIAYRAYLEPVAGAGKGLIQALSQRAVAVVTDDYPCFFLPRMIEAARRQIPVRFELVDSNGLLPLRASPRAFLRAVDFRRFIQRSIQKELEHVPRARPLRAGMLPKLRAVPRDIQERWPFLDSDRLIRGQVAIDELPIDHRTAAVQTRGGYRAARRELASFVEARLSEYSEKRNHPDWNMTSRLSPYLHFGHLSSHELFDSVAKQEGFDPQEASVFGSRRRGERQGFWPVAPGAEAFLDQLVTWRELGFNFCHHRPKDYDRYDSLPNFARRTLEKHAGDPRPTLYTRAQLGAAQTHDPLWNAAQRELLATGVIHTTLRMLWGKKVLEWSHSPEEALETLIELNNQFALDGRDPNSYSGIFWCLGRYDRAWGPERPIFGTVRSMSSDNQRRKLKLTEYMKRWSSPNPQIEDGDTLY